MSADRACVLLVDDSHDVRASMRRVLVQAGYDVVEAGSGEAALALVGEAAAFDVLVTDVRMPGRYDGITLASCWREKVPGRPVLFVSGHADGQLDPGALGPHEAALPKPFQRAALLDAVQRLLALCPTAAVPASASAGQSSRSNVEHLASGPDAGH